MRACPLRHPCSLFNLIKQIDDGTGLKTEGRVLSRAVPAFRRVLGLRSSKKTKRCSQKCISVTKVHKSEDVHSIRSEEMKLEATYVIKGIELQGKKV